IEAEVVHAGIVEEGLREAAQDVPAADAAPGIEGGVLDELALARGAGRVGSDYGLRDRAGDGDDEVRCLRGGNAVGEDLALQARARERPRHGVRSIVEDS